MFRRSGSVATFLVEGVAPNPRDAAFCEKLEAHRFKGIERAASEEEAVGWVTAADPTGATFLPDDIDMDGMTWLRIRMDRKRLPSVWQKIYRAEAERSRGRKLSAAEKKELKQELMERLLPGQLPSVTMVDVLYAHETRTAMAFGTSTRIRDALVNLFHRTFGATLVPLGPGTWAGTLGLEREARDWLQRVAPVRWPRAGEEDLGGRRPRPESAPVRRALPPETPAAGPGRSEVTGELATGELAADGDDGIPEPGLEDRAEVGFTEAGSPGADDEPAGRDVSDPDPSGNGLPESDPSDDRASDDRAAEDRAFDDQPGVEPGSATVTHAASHAPGDDTVPHQEEHGA